MPKPVNLSEPVDDLRKAGVQLQDALTFTRTRLDRIRNKSLLIEALRVIDRTEYVFITVSRTVQMVESTRRILTNNFGLGANDILTLMGCDRYTASITAKGAIDLVNNSVRLALADINRMNMTLDKEFENAKK